MYYPDLMGLIIFCGSLLLMLLTVPWQQIERFMLFGIVSGLGIAFLLILIMDHWLGLWEFHRVDFFYLGRIPLFLSAAWSPTEIFFAYFLSRYQQPFLRYLLILFIPGVAAGIHFVLGLNQMLTYQHWNLFGTFLVSLVIHGGLAYFIYQKYPVRMEIG
jgi:hypothetical protein